MNRKLNFYSPLIKLSIALSIQFLIELLVESVRCSPFKDKKWQNPCLNNSRKSSPRGQVAEKILDYRQ
ncbi:MAG: hypothetical protein QX199_16460 [Methylococcaceae bacterium]